MLVRAMSRLSCVENMLFVKARFFESGEPTRYAPKGTSMLSENFSIFIFILFNNLLVKNLRKLDEKGPFSAKCWHKSYAMESFSSNWAPF